MISLFRNRLKVTLFIVLIGGILSAKEVPFNDAKLAAQNFFRQVSGKETASSTLKYTLSDQKNRALIYVFGFSGQKGFVILSADDVAEPVIGYSAENDFSMPEKGSSFDFFLSKRKQEIQTYILNNTQAGQVESARWEQLIQGNFKANKSQAAVTPLLSTKWNQSPFYNDSCPGGSVTGCVATTMAQIMKYWAYPSTGTASHSYCCCQSEGFTNNYGVQKANYGATTYNWAAMPDVLTGPNAEVARLKFHCGVAVEMNYDPSGSSAMVINQDYPVCAENSYKNYFKYNPLTLLGVYRNVYDDATWIGMMKNDLDLGRPIQYVGFGNVGGHTWVCDGYDQNDMFHMNWGWGGNSDGYFNINSLTTNAGDFSQWQQALFGIVPMFTNTNDAGIISLSQKTNACSGNTYSPKIKVRNYGNSTLTSFVVNYQLDGGSITTYNWSGNLMSGQFTEISLTTYTLSPGAHSFSVNISAPNNAGDQDLSNNSSQYNLNIISNGTFPLVDGFESVPLTTSQWVKLQPNSGNPWTLTNQVKASGSYALMVDNLSNTPGNKSILSGLINLNTFNVAEPHLAFKTAYQRKNNSNEDELRVEVSQDCGLSWILQWSNKGAALSTSSLVSNSPYLPSSAEFKQNDITVPFSNDLLVRFVFASDIVSPGNNVYLDDINLYDATQVGLLEIDQNTMGPVSLFPNPTSGVAVITIEAARSNRLQIRILDVSGRSVSVQNEVLQMNATHEFLIHCESFSPGIYFVELSDGESKITRKLVVN